MNDAGPTRRMILGGGLLVLAACTSGAQPEPVPPVDPDVAVREAVAAGVTRLIEQYDEAMAGQPALRAELQPLAAEHDAHLAAIRPRRAGQSRSPSPVTSAPAGTETATTSAPSTSSPASPAATRRELARAERDAAADRVAQAATASPELARLIASIGASEAAHAALLRGRA